MRPKQILERIRLLAPPIRYLLYILIITKYIRYKYHRTLTTLLLIIAGFLVHLSIPPHPIRLPFTIGLTALLAFYINL